MVKDFDIDKHEYGGWRHRRHLRRQMKEDEAEARLELMNQLLDSRPANDPDYKEKFMQEWESKTRKNSTE